MWQALYLLSHPPTLILDTCSALSWKESNQEETATVSDVEMTRDLAGLEIVSRSFYRLESEAQKEEMCLRSVSLKPSVLWGWKMRCPDSEASDTQREPVCVHWLGAYRRHQPWVSSWRPMAPPVLSSQENQILSPALKGQWIRLL